MNPEIEGDLLWKTQTTKKVMNENLSKTSDSEDPKEESRSWWTSFKLIFFLQLISKLLHAMRKPREKLRQQVRNWETHMIGAMEKGVEAARMSEPPKGSYEGVNLEVLPKYICYKAALVREKMTMQVLVALVAGVFAIYFAISRFEVLSLYSKLREKEYILAPGVQDFTAASPHTVSDSYVQAAVTDFLNRLGNINPVNIQEQYLTLAESMNAQLRVKFQAESLEWINKVKDDNLSEILTVLEKEIRSNEDGFYKVTAITRVDSYINADHIGARDEVVQMILKLVPPSRNSRWFIEIESLSRSTADAFKTKESLKKENSK